MPPTSDGEPGRRTVACRLSKLVPDAMTIGDIQLAVRRVHEATIHATALLNIHIRRCISNNIPLSEDLFERNWILKAFQEVTVCSGERSVQRDPGLAESMTAMPAFDAVNRTGLTQLFMSNATFIASNAKNNVWMHFNRRLLTYVKRRLEMPKEQYDTMTKDQKKYRFLQLNRVATDIRRLPTEEITSDPEYHEFVNLERERLRIDASVDDWDNKPLVWHLKAKPHAFLVAISMMSQFNEESGRGGFALYPVRRSMVPQFIRFSALAFNQVLQALRNERLQRKKRPRGEIEDFTFANTMNYRAAQISQRWRIDDGFSTDGVSARIDQFVGTNEDVQQMRLKKSEAAQRRAAAAKRKREGAPEPEKTKGTAKKKAAKPELTEMPRRGIWAIDELKRISRLELGDIHVIGIDPGKRELVVATDSDDRNSPAVRYTISQRQKDMRTRQFADELRRLKPKDVVDAERSLSQFNSRSANLETFRSYVTARQTHLNAFMNYYGELHHRQRHWKTYIKRQKSEQNLYNRLAAFQKDDDRKIVLAYGSWGLVAGSPSACNKGNPPCIGVGLMRKISKHFVVALTPEHYTSKTCHKCLGTCGPHPTMRSTRNNREIRGLRVCQDESCKALLNRDKNASRNIGLQFKRLFEGQGCIKSMSEHEIELTRHRMCLECEE